MMTGRLTDPYPADPIRTGRSNRENGRVTGQSRLLHRPRPDPAPRLRLFCFPYAGSGASGFHSWAARMPVGVELCAVRLPGREGRRDEPALSSVADLAEGLVSELAPWLQTDFAFFGHSLGALVAFEVSRTLRRRARPLPLRLFASGKGAPGRPDLSPRFSHLSDAAFVTGIAEHYGAFPREILAEPGMLEILLPPLRADMTAVETYVHRPEVPLPVPITLFMGADDPETMGQGRSGWRELTSAGVEERFFPGGHFFLLSQREALLASLSTDVARLIWGKSHGA